MFYEDHLIESSDSEHAAPEGVPAEGETLSATSSHYPFPTRTASAAAAAAALGANVTSSGISSGGAATGATASAADIHLLMEAAENERHCPDVLPYPTTVVESVLALLAQRRLSIEQLSEAERHAAATEATVSLLPFKPSDIISLELQRIQFFLCELLRCRLRKIESLCTLIYYEGLAERQEARQQQRQQRASDGAVNEEVEEEEEEGLDFLSVSTPQRANLSPRERVVADRLAVAKQQAVLQAGLQAAPAPLQRLTPHLPHAEGLEVLPEPDLSTYVFGVALEDLGVVQVGELAEQAIEEGEIFLMPYRTFRQYVIAGRVRLL